LPLARGVFSFPFFVNSPKKTILPYYCAFSFIFLALRMDKLNTLLEMLGQSQALMIFVLVGFSLSFILFILFVRSLMTGGRAPAMATQLQQSAAPILQGDSPEDSAPPTRPEENATPVPVSRRKSQPEAVDFHEDFVQNLKGVSEDTKFVLDQLVERLEQVDTELHEKSALVHQLREEAQDLQENVNELDGSRARKDYMMLALGFLGGFALAAGAAVVYFLMFHAAA
jgi:hypothetical protein